MIHTPVVINELHNQNTVKIIYSQMISYRKVLSFSLDLNIHFLVYLDSIFGIYSHRSTQQIRLVLGGLVGSVRSVGSLLTTAQLRA